MAEVIVGPLLSKLQEVAVKEAQALAAVSGDIEELRDKLIWLQALVHETDLRSRQDGSRLIRVLACQIREVSFEAEDAVDQFYLQADLSRRFGRNWGRAAVEFNFNFRTHICVRFTLSRCIQSLNARLEEIVDNGSKYSNDDSSGNNGKRWRACHAIPPRRQGWDQEYTMPFKLSVRYVEKHELDRRLKKKSGPMLEVIPVVGVGGVGKRAFLRHACEDESFKNVFDIRIRMNLPPDIDESSMMEQIKKKLIRECSSLFKQQQEMREADLQQVCYLVVLDSPINTTTWCKVEPKLLRMAAKAGSKILVPVTSSPGELTDTSIKMKPLNKKESITFFNQVYGLKGLRGTNDQTVEMDKIRSNILKITGGLSLGVVLLAKLMRTMDFSKWESAAEYIMCSNEDSKLQTIVSVSVDDLPDELKSCLLFTAGFPENRVIDAQQLVRLWMAEGFLIQHHGLETEQLGQCYLKELIHRGLLQLVSKTRAHGDVGHCVEWVTIHDQIHPLLRSEAQRTSFMHVHHGGCIPALGNTRRLALHKYNNNFNALSNGLGSTLEDRPSRTEPTLKMHELLQESRYLRVINLEGINVGSGLPDCIGEMVHLQYLGVRNQNLEKLPSSVGNLGNLQTIDVRNTKVRKLSKRIWKIKALRHVLGNHLSFPSTGDDLKLMQTLETVTITTMTKRGKKPGLRSLQRLHVVDLNDSLGTALETLLQAVGYSLDSLSLTGDVIPINLCAGASASFLEHVVSLELDGKLPHHASNGDNLSGILTRLTRLVLRSTKIKQDFIHVISKLPALAELVLHKDSYEDAELDLCTHRFSSLTALEISGLATLKEVFVPDNTTTWKSPIELTLIDNANQVQVYTHKHCNYCPREMGQLQVSAGQNNQENGGQTSNGQDYNEPYEATTMGHGESSHTTEANNDNQSLFPPFPEMILAAVDDNNSSKTAIKRYIKEQYGDLVLKHLDHMVQCRKLETRLHAGKNKYSRPSQPNMPRND